MKELARLMDVEPVLTAPYLCDVELARQLVGDEVERGEVVIVIDEAEGPSVALYLDEDKVNGPGGLELLDEGVSHLLYLSFRSESQVSQLELELQAEVDKWTLQLLSGFGPHVISLRDKSRALRRAYFDDASFLDEETSESGARYRLAVTAASQYTARLEETVLRSNFSQGSLLPELRHFYRLPRLEKLAHARR